MKTTSVPYMLLTTNKVCEPTEASQQYTSVNSFQIAERSRPRPLQRLLHPRPGLNLGPPYSLLSRFPMRFSERHLARAQSAWGLLANGAGEGRSSPPHLRSAPWVAST
jgi:hypothetical protein